MKTKKINGKVIVSVYNHRSVDIWALKIATPSQGDELGYLVELISGVRHFDTIFEAIETIEKDWK